MRRLRPAYPPQRRAALALAEFGGIEQVKQAVRDRPRGHQVSSFCWQDARYGMRQLRRNRGFTLYCGGHPGPGNWCDHGDLFRRLLTFAETASVLPTRTGW